MKNKKLVYIAFFLMALVQLYVPYKMISNRNDVLENGKHLKFLLNSNDPYDHFRGKYINIDFIANKFKTSDKNIWKNGDEVYVTFKNDEYGFAMIKSVSRQKPKGTETYVRAEIDRFYDNEVEILYPFNKYFLNEAISESTEKMLIEAHNDKSKIVFVVVSVKDGEAVLKDLKIEDIPVDLDVKL